jgi:hypothetical protein
LKYASAREFLSSTIPVAALRLCADADSVALSEQSNGLQVSSFEIARTVQSNRNPPGT